MSYLAALALTCDIDAMSEGTLAFGQEPLLRVRGPLLQCQLLETALLTIVNFQTLIATKASRVCAAAQGEPVIEFGLRRAQGIDGGLAASRAAHIGGCAATSNVLAGKLYGIPVRGTHAHSWVMSFDSEMEAFEEYARVLPNNCVFLVDTYDTLQGVRHAIEVGKQLKGQGHRMVGIRLDSGDLAYLSIEARKLLDEAGFADAAILATNDLDERIIENLKLQGAKIAVWGVGTKLVTAYDQPALGGSTSSARFRTPAVSGTASSSFPTRPPRRVSPDSPGPSVCRLDRFVGDMIYDERLGIDPRLTIVDPRDPARQKVLQTIWEAQRLVVPGTATTDIVSKESEPLAAFAHRAVAAARDAPSHDSPVHEPSRVSRRARHWPLRTPRKNDPRVACVTIWTCLDLVSN